MSLCRLFRFWRWSQTLSARLVFRALLQSCVESLLPELSSRPEACFFRTLEWGDLRFARSVSTTEEPQVPRLRYDATRLRSARDDNSCNSILTARFSKAFEK